MIDIDTLPVEEMPGQSFDLDIDIITRTMVEEIDAESYNEEASKKYGIE